MKKSLCVLKVLLTTYTTAIFIYSILDKIFPYCFYFFLLLLSTFKPQTAHGSYCELLQISKRTGARLKSGVPMMGIPPNELSKIQTLLLLKLG